jgi:uncharacterized protein YuzE
MFGEIMKKTNFNYDKMSDTLSILFAENKNATGIELNENVLLRVDLKKQSAVGLDLFNYSILSEPTEIGFRSLPLTELNELPKEIRATVIKILLSKPVSEVLLLSAFTGSKVENMPITSLSSKVLQKQAA